MMSKNARREQEQEVYLPLERGQIEYIRHGGRKADQEAAESSTVQKA